MDGSERRRAVRVACRVPIRIGGSKRWLEAAALDLSRTGVRLTLAVEGLGLEGAPTLLTLARQLCEVFPTNARAEFDAGRLGSLVARRLEIVRIGLSCGKQPLADLCCSFDWALSDVDAAALDLDLPPLSDEIPVQVVPATDSEIQSGSSLRGRSRKQDGFVEPYARRSGRRYQAILMPEDRQRAPIVGWTESVDRSGAVLRVPQRRALGLPPTIKDVAKVVVLLCEIYGSRLTLKIVDGARPLWQGPVLLRAAEELPSSSDELLLDVRFARSLVPSEIEVLHLA